MENKYSKDVEYFIKNCKDFLVDEYKTKSDIDKKHLKIISNFKKNFKNNNSFIENNLRDWSMQSDNSCPPQLSFQHFKSIGILKTIKNFVKKKFNYKLKEHNRSFFDDINFLKNNNFTSFLKLNPVHKTPFCNDFYIFDKITTNYRWNRYAYIAEKIDKLKLIKKSNAICLDIGCFYGGLQSFLKKKYPEINIILIDFNHQLCRSYVFLKNIFPRSNHVLPDQIHDLKNFSKKKNYIIYLPIKKSGLIKDLSIDVVTNIYSFGEMKRKTFANYFSLLQKAKTIYCVNRFVSSPFFEKTYDSDLSIIDYYKNKFKISYFDIFPIHHYQTHYSKLYGKKAYRPISSPYFELIMEKNF